MFWLSLHDALEDTRCPIGKVQGVPPTADNSWQICVFPDGTLHSFATGQVNELSIGQAVTPLDWIHVTLTRGGTLHTLAIGGGGAHEQIQVPETFFDDGKVTIGGDLDNDFTSAAFPGALDDVRIYNRALDADEISTIAGITPRP